MTRAARAALLAACALATAALALVPNPGDSPLGRVASIDGDGPDPRYDAPIDGDAIREAGALLPDDTTYALVAPGLDPLATGNLKAAAQLFLAPALPVQDLGRAEWLLLYGAAARDAPSGRRLGREVTLVRVAR